MNVKCVDKLSENIIMACKKPQRPQKFDRGSIVMDGVLVLNS